MPNTWFQFKQFRINQDKTAMKVGVDSVLLGAVANFNKPKTILDIGAGTGLLSFMSEQRTDAQIIALEIDEDAYKQCIENIVLNNKIESIKAYHISVQDFAKQSNQKFDHIISNPPYFDNSFQAENRQRNIARHSQELTHVELISSVSKLLSEKGTFTLILPYEKHENFIQFSLEKRLYSVRKIIVFPNEIKESNRVIMEFSKIKKELFEEKIYIRNSKTNEYSKEYKNLTKDFYLNT